MEDDAAQTDEGNEEEYLQRVHDMVGELRCHYVEAEEEGQQQAENGGGSEQWVDADEEACGEAPG